MQAEQQLIDRVRDAQESMEQADELIRAYMPFIRSETSKYLGRICTEHDDEMSIAMIAFHEAVRGYARGRGTFLKYAALTIRSRLIDYHRAEARHRGTISMETPVNDGESTIADELPAQGNHAEEIVYREATRQEIAELAAVMSEFGISFTDVAENCPRQERTLNACQRVLKYAIAHPGIPEDLLRTKKLPLAQLAQGAGVERKTLERHRKYIVALLLIQTNGYEIIRGHLKRAVSAKGGEPQ